MDKNTEKIKKLIIEELTKSEVRNMINVETDSLLDSRQFKEKVKDISAKVIEELYKILWTRKNFWSDAIKK